MTRGRYCARAVAKNACSVAANCHGQAMDNGNYRQALQTVRVHAVLCRVEQLGHPYEPAKDAAVRLLVGTLERIARRNPGTAEDQTRIRERLEQQL